MSDTFAILASGIVRSSIWFEDSDTRILWVTLLALKDKNGNVFGCVKGLADTAKIPIDKCREALEKFKSPDPESTSPENEGRRIEEIDRGWHIINHQKIRESFSKKFRQEYMREYMREYRVPEKGSPEEPKQRKSFEPAKKVLAHLNQKTGNKFREVESNLAIIQCRLEERDVTMDGCMEMINRMVEIWGIDPKMRQYLRPATLFGKQKFDGYYSAAGLPVGESFGEKQQKQASAMTDAELVAAAQG